jgi:hypothetical protein
MVGTYLAYSLLVDQPGTGNFFAILHYQAFATKTWDLFGLRSAWSSPEHRDFGRITKNEVKGQSGKHSVQ